MITGEDLYNVMCAMVPLYFAMLIAYASVKWCKLFTPDQCSGINRFVAVFAVPVLSFHFISHNNPYNMDSKFILADTISKLILLLFLSMWALFFSCGSLDWLITLFSLSSLPNTLVMGIPLLQAMYGPITHSLMVHLLVLQCIIWYTVLVCLFEYRAATLLIHTHFPGPTAASITQFEIDGDVISLDGRDVALRTESETDNQGCIRVRIRRSTSSSTPRPSNLSNADIFSVNTPPQLLHEATAAGVGHDIGFGFLSGSPRLSGYASSDAYSLQPTPRRSNFNELEATATPVWERSPMTGVRMCRQSPVMAVSAGPPGRYEDGDREGSKHITALTTTSEKEFSFRDCSKMATAADEEGGPKEEQGMPGRVVMMRLILVVVGRKLSRNPNTYSSALGLLWSLISFKWNVGMPSLVKSSIKIISDAGLGMAMFSLGLFMALQERVIACGPKRAAMAMAIRFIGGPLIMSAASIAVGLRGPILHTAIVQAALPQGIVPFVFAREYGLHPDILSTGVIFGMLVSLPVTLLYYIFLGL